ncbi:S49 family peptidase [Myroides odoratimimus]|uniref:S49 family peptidase n=1 Tax=Myroides odoratimimus TaxID=76832 RepID=UPI0025761669|nr:S49 family peptidase [Myroides odoratimimus]MDM1529031.1 S49 family peptidase [Myroides odoratimimus]
MKVNKIASEILRGEWFFQPEAIKAYAPIAYDFLYGNNKQLRVDDARPEAIFTAYTSNGAPIRPNENGQLDIPKGSIAVVDSIGVLVKYGDWCTYGALDIVNALKFADAHPNIIGTVLNVDGPGGSVAAVGPFVEFGKNKTKPVVALCDCAASAHLYTTLAVADHVMADNNISAMIGSIGVVITWMDNSKYLENLGIKEHVIYADESEDKGKAYYEALKGNYEIVKKDMLSPAAVQFQNFVKLKRPNLIVDHPGLMTGKTFGADESVEIGLIDGIGSLEEAKQMVSILSEIKRK